MDKVVIGVLGFGLFAAAFISSIERGEKIQQLQTQNQQLRTQSQQLQAENLELKQKFEAFQLGVVSAK